MKVSGLPDPESGCVGAATSVEYESVMTFKSSDPATSVVAAVGWCGVAAFSFWGVLGTMKIWFAIPIGLALALVAVGYAIESLAQELTIRRWAISQVVFTVFAVAFLLAGIFNAEIRGLARWILFVGTGVFGLAAVLSAIAAKDLF